MTISDTLSPPYPRIRGKHISYPCYVERKIDGTLNMCKNGMLISKSGKTRTGFPVTDYLKDIPYTLYGELHWGEGKSGDLYKLLKNPNDDQLNYTIFDVDLPYTYELRKGWILHHIKPNGQVRVISALFCSNKRELDLLYDIILEEGYEGIVVKLPHNPLIKAGNPYWIKRKPNATKVPVLR